MLSGCELYGGEVCWEFVCENLDDSCIVFGICWCWGIGGVRIWWVCILCLFTECRVSMYIMVLLPSTGEEGEFGSVVVSWCCYGGGGHLVL